MSSTAVLFKGPVSLILPSPLGLISHQRDPHVWVGLQAKRNYGDADEENRNNPNNLEIVLKVAYILSKPTLATMEEYGSSNMDQILGLVFCHQLTVPLK